MDLSRLSTDELRERLLDHNRKVSTSPESVTQEDLDDAWAVVFETIKRNNETADRQSEQLQQLQDDMEELMATDIVYRAAYKFVMTHGLELQFEAFMERELSEFTSKVIPFPKVQ